MYMRVAGLGSIVPLPASIPIKFAVITRTQTHKGGVLPTHCRYFLRVSSDLGPIAIPICWFFFFLFLRKKNGVLDQQKTWSYGIKT